jgi:hypothetical protein
MRIHKILIAGTLLAVLSVGLAGCGGDDEVGDAVNSVTEQAGNAANSVGDAVSGSDVTIPLTAQGGSNVTGEAKLVSDGNQTKVTLDLENAPGPHPAHIHEGTCADLNPAPKFPLRDVVDGKSETTVDVTVDAIRSSPHAINVHQSAANLDTYVACGDLPTTGGGSAGTTTSTTTGTTTTP